MSAVNHAWTFKKTKQTLETHIVNIAFVNASENCIPSCRLQTPCIRYDKSDRMFVRHVAYVKKNNNKKKVKQNKTKRCYVIIPSAQLLLIICVWLVVWRQTTCQCIGKNTQKHLLWCSWRMIDIWPDDLRRWRFDSSRKRDEDPKVRSINVNRIWSLSDRSSSIIMNANELREQCSPPPLSLSLSLSCSNWVIVTHTVHL